MCVLYTVLEWVLIFFRFFASICELSGVPRGVIWGHRLGVPGGTQPGQSLLGLRKKSKKHKKKWPKKQVAWLGSISYSIIAIGISEMVEALGSSKVTERKVVAQTELGSCVEGEFIGQVKNYLIRAMQWRVWMEFVFIWMFMMSLVEPRKNFYMSWWSSIFMAKKIFFKNGNFFFSTWCMEHISIYIHFDQLMKFYKTPEEFWLKVIVVESYDFIKFFPCKSL